MWEAHQKILSQFETSWMLESLWDRAEFFCKRMFGGLAVYMGPDLKLVIMESPGETVWKGHDFGFALWNGLLIATSREHHESLILEFPNLVSHPVLGKWLFLSAEREDFEQEAEEIVSLVRRGDSRVGVPPSSKARRLKRKKSVKKRGNTGK